MSFRHDDSIDGVVELGDYISIRDLAASIELRPMQVVAMLKEWGIKGIGIESSVDFDTAKAVVIQFERVVRYKP